MSDKRPERVYLNTKKLDDLSGCTGSPYNCGVLEEQFPCLRRCYLKNSTMPCRNETVCRYCIIWTSIPCGESLSVTTIFECSLYGHYVRIKD